MIRPITIVCLLALISSCQIDLQPLTGKIEAEVNKAIDRGFDGIVVYVNQAGKSSFYSAGWKNREKQIPADPHALFKIASISKLYIAAATTKLIANQSLSLDNTLTELLPDRAKGIEYSDQITLRMLLQHRSGIPDFADMHYPWDSPFKDNSKAYTLVMGMPADFKPGKKYRYSNTNYLLIGEILDRTLGYSHHQYIQIEILNPLGLNNTYSLLNDVDINDVTSGYFVGYEGDDIKYNDFIHPGGSMVATAEDVGIFLKALIDSTLFNAEEQAIYSSVYEYGHTGWLPGYTSIARYHSDIDAVVIQFVNTSSNEMFWLELERVYNRIVRILEKEY